ncbi:MAG: PAAR domain-containing protein [bacterium]
MPGISTINSLGSGICCCHSNPTCISMTGVLTTGAGSHFLENNQVSRIGDIVIGFCGHVGVMVTGSPTYFSEGSQVVRIGDSFSGCFTGVLITGAATGLTA